MHLTAEKYIEQYPKAYDIIHQDVYVDDCISGALSENVDIFVAWNQTNSNHHCSPHCFPKIGS